MTELQTIGLFLLGMLAGALLARPKREEPPAIIDLGEFTHGHKWRDE